MSDREIELLELLVKGYTYNRISEETFIAIGTVKQHLHRIYSKLQVANKVQAINKFRNSK